MRSRRRRRGASHACRQQQQEQRILHRAPPPCPCAAGHCARGRRPTMSLGPRPCPTFTSWSACCPAPLVGGVAGAAGSSRTGQATLSCAACCAGLRCVCCPRACMRRHAHPCHHVHPPPLAEWKAWVGGRLLQPYLRQKQVGPLQLSSANFAGSWSASGARTGVALPVAHQSTCPLPAGQRGGRRQQHERRQHGGGRNAAVQFLPRWGQRAGCGPDHWVPTAEVGGI